MNRMDNLKEIIDHGDGILSISVAPNGAREYSELLETIDFLCDAGMNQLLTIAFEPHAVKLAEIAPAERMMVLRGIEKGAYTEMYFDNVKVIRDKHKSFPIVATPMLGDVICYGQKRFLKRCVETGVDGMDTAIYSAIEDPAGFRRDAEEMGIKFICAMNAGSVDLNNPEHVSTVENLVRVTSGELFLVPAIPGTGDGIDGEKVKPYVEAIRKMQTKYENLCPIIGIGGVSTPEDAHQLVHVAGVDGVHFSTAFMKRIFAGEPYSRIRHWLEAVKAAMHR